MWDSFICSDPIMFSVIHAPEKIREALASYQKHHSFRTAARSVGVGKSTLHRWWRSFHRLLGVRSRHQHKKARRARTPKYPGLVQQLQQLFAGESTLRYHTLRSIRSMLPPDAQPSLSHLYRALRAARISRRRFIASKVCPRSADNMEQLTRTFAVQLALLADHEIVCIDETGFCNSGMAMYSYFPRGKQPCAMHVPRRDKRSVLAAIHPSPLLLGRASVHAAVDCRCADQRHRLVREVLLAHRDGVDVHMYVCGLAPARL